MQVFRRMLQLAWNVRRSTTFLVALVALVANLSFRSNHLLDKRMHASRDQSPSLGDASAAELGGEAP